MPPKTKISASFSILSPNFRVLADLKRLNTNKRTGRLPFFFYLANANFLGMVKDFLMTDSTVEELGEYMGKLLYDDIADMLTDEEIELFETYIRASSDKRLYESINDISGDLYDRRDTVYIKEYVKELYKKMDGMYADMVNEIQRGLKRRLEDLVYEMMYQFELAHGLY